jgi:hypothetical protein
VNKTILLLWGALLLVVVAQAQPATDTARQRIAADSIRLADSLRLAQSLAMQRADSTRYDSLVRNVNQAGWDKLLNSSGVPVNPAYDFTAPSRRLNEPAKKMSQGMEWLFYMFCGVLLLFGILKQVFSKYFSDIFSLFFKTSFRQKQIRDQLQQSPLPSLLFNAFFIISAAIYISFLLQYYGLVAPGQFWQMLLYCIILLGAVYGMKYAALKFSGWLFNIREATDTYIFIIFLVNKWLGVILLPFSLFIAFSKSGILPVVVIISLFVSGLLLAFRFILSYGPARNEVSVSQFHFFIYLCAFEIAPVLILYRALLNYFNIT